MKEMDACLMRKRVHGKIGKTLINFRFSFPHEIWPVTSIKITAEREKKEKKRTHTHSRNEIGKRQQIDQFLHVIISTRIVRRTRV